MLKERRLKKFLKENEKDINSVMKTITELFNKIGKKHNDQALQLGFQGAIIYSFLKATNVEKKEKVQLVKNILKQVKREK